MGGELMQTYHIFNDHGLSIQEDFDYMREAREFARENYGTPFYVEPV